MDCVDQFRDCFISWIYSNSRIFLYSFIFIQTLPDPAENFNPRELQILLHRSTRSYRTLLGCHSFLHYLHHPCHFYSPDLHLLETLKHSPNSNLGVFNSVLTWSCPKSLKIYGWGFPRTFFDRSHKRFNLWRKHASFIFLHNIHARNFNDFSQYPDWLLMEGPQT